MISGFGLSPSLLKRCENKNEECMKRKVIQIISAQDTEIQGGFLMALCDDGSIWDYRPVSVGGEGRTPTTINKWLRVDGPPDNIE